eukprot:10583171-Karenia_brevis.AAC.1
MVTPPSFGGGDDGDGGSDDEPHDGYVYDPTPFEVPMSNNDGHQSSSARTLAHIEPCQYALSNTFWCD